MEDPFVKWFSFLRDDNIAPFPRKENRKSPFLTFFLANNHRMTKKAGGSGCNILRFQCKYRKSVLFFLPCRIYYRKFISIENRTGAAS